MTSLTLDQFRSLKNLPSLPEQVDNVLKYLETSSSMDYSIMEMIQYDPTMAAAVLRTANMPIYGFPRQVSSLQQAEALLGPGTIKNIILRTPILEKFLKNSSVSIDYIQLWIHSGITATLSGSLARLIGGIESDVSFTLGLIHEVGTMALSVYSPDSFIKVQKHSNENNTSLIEAEKQILGFSHFDIAEVMMDSWQFPPQLNQIILQCKDPDKNKTNFEIAGVVILAKLLAEEWGFPSTIKGTEYFERKKLLNMLRISEKNLEAWESELKKYAQFALNTMKTPQNKN